RWYPDAGPPVRVLPPLPSVRYRLIALVLALILILAAAGGAWLWWTSQPHSKPGSANVEFDTGPHLPAPPPKLAELPWKMYGFDEERTHFTPVHRHRPPFARAWMVPAR